MAGNAEVLRVAGSAAGRDRHRSGGGRPFRGSAVASGQEVGRVVGLWLREQRDVVTR